MGTKPYKIGDDLLYLLLIRTLTGAVKAVSVVIAVFGVHFLDPVFLVIENFVNKPVEQEFIFSRSSYTFVPGKNIVQTLTTLSRGNFEKQFTRMNPGNLAEKTLRDQNS